MSTEILEEETRRVSLREQELLLEELDLQDGLVDCIEKLNPEPEHPKHDPLAWMTDEKFNNQTPSRRTGDD